MKNLVFMGIAILTASSAFAGSGTCDQSQSLVCTEKKVMKDGSLAIGSVVVGQIQDIEPEPFDPANCQATIELDTVAGMFVADYDERNQLMTSWERTPGQADKTFFVGRAVKLNETVFTDLVAAPAGSGVLTVDMECVIKK